MNKQLIKPDLSTKGTIGDCKIYARSVFHIASTGKYPTAWSNWQKAKYKHGVNEPLPKDVAILCWFSGYGGAGHVVVSVPSKGFYSSPYSLDKTKHYQEGTNTHALLPSLSEVERIYGVKYVGWTEDIEDKRVAIADNNATVEDMVNKGDITNLFQWLLGRKPDSKSFEMVGQRWPVVVKHIVMSKEYQDRQKKINSDSKYQDLVNKLKGLIGK